MGRSCQDPKTGNSEAPEGNVTCRAGGAWTVKLILSEKLDGSGSWAEGRQESGWDRGTTEGPLVFYRAVSICLFIILFKIYLVTAVFNLITCHPNNCQNPCLVTNICLKSELIFWVCWRFQWNSKKKHHDNIFFRGIFLDYEWENQCVRWKKAIGKKYLKGSVWWTFILVLVLYTKNSGFCRAKDSYSFNLFAYFMLYQKKNYDRVMKALDSITSIREMTQVSLKIFT